MSEQLADMPVFEIPGGMVRFSSVAPFYWSDVQVVFNGNFYDNNWWRMGARKRNPGRHRRLKRRG